MILAYGSSNKFRDIGFCDKISLANLSLLNMFSSEKLIYWLKFRLKCPFIITKRANRGIKNLLVKFEDICYELKKHDIFDCYALISNNVVF